MAYGWMEQVYSKPFAEALASDQTFREWLLRRTRFAEIAPGARLLQEEIEAKRSSATWWRSNFTEKCRCQGCSGQETDILGVFEAASGRRFALHIEVKHPEDAFKSKRDQAANYALRAACWARTPPSAVVRHDDADTMLLYDAPMQTKFAPHLPKFGSVVTFAEISKVAPHSVPTAGDIEAARLAHLADRVAAKAKKLLKQVR